MTSFAKAFEPSSWAAAPDGPKHGDAPGGDGVGDPGDQRRLRADDHQVGAEPSARAATASPSIGSTSCRVATSAMPGVARGGVHLGHVGVEGKGAGERVLAAAGADHEGLHGA